MQGCRQGIQCACVQVLVPGEMQTGSRGSDARGRGTGWEKGVAMAYKTGDQLLVQNAWWSDPSDVIFMTRAGL